MVNKVFFVLSILNSSGLTSRTRHLITGCSKLFSENVREWILENSSSKRFLELFEGRSRYSVRLDDSRTLFK